MAGMLVSTKVKDTVGVQMHKVQYLLSAATASVGSLLGWSFNYFPAQNMMLINVPSPTADGNIQFVSNDVIPTQPWAIFQNMPAQCWKLFGNDILYGTADGKVMQAWTGSRDNILLDGTGGDAITSLIQQAYNYLGESATQKQVDMYRLNFITSAPDEVIYSSVMLYDFALQTALTPNALAYHRESLWDNAIWNQDYWGSSGTIQKNVWNQALGLGYCASIAMSMKSTTEVIWVSTDFSYKHGGLL